MVVCYINILCQNLEKKLGMIQAFDESYDEFFSQDHR